MADQVPPAPAWDGAATDRKSRAGRGSDPALLESGELSHFGL